MLSKKMRGGRGLFSGRGRASKRIANPLLGVEFFIHPSPIAQLAVVVSKKVAKTAVLRNRFKRQVHTILREEYNKLKGGQGIIIFAKSGATLVDYPTLQSSVKDLLAAAGLYR